MKFIFKREFIGEITELERKFRYSHVKDGSGPKLNNNWEMHMINWISINGSVLKMIFRYNYKVSTLQIFSSIIKSQ